MEVKEKNEPGVPFAKIWGNFVRALYPNWLPSAKLEINF